MGRLGLPTKARNRSFVMVGLDPTIHAAGTSVDPWRRPRVTVEDERQTEARLAAFLI
ncbi:hypothetical protein GCM10023069_53990 [Shinella granuli]